MQQYSVFSLLFFLCSIISLNAQTLVNPVIKGFGTIGDAPQATVKPDPSLDYKIVIDIATGGENKSQVFFSLNNVARLINLHVMGGVPKENLYVVVAIHGSAIWSVLNHEMYRKKFGIENPHVALFQELLAHNVKIVVCSQSMMKRQISPSELVPGLEVATSALTVLSTYQLRGYAALKF